MARNRVIGAGGRIPWHLAEDMRFFKRMTTGHTVVMGRRTFESIGRPLPGRVTVVISRGAPIPGTITLPDIAALDRDRFPGDIFIAGGAALYACALPLCSDLYLTLIHRDVEGDVLFPPFEDRFDLAATLLSTPEFEIRHYHNRALHPGAPQP